MQEKGGKEGRLGLGRERWGLWRRKVTGEGKNGKERLQRVGGREEMGSDRIG